MRKERKEVNPEYSISSPSFLGRRAEQLSWLIEQQVIPVFEEFGIIVPVRSCSLIVALAELEVATATDLARRLQQSHQLVLQKIPALIKLRILERRPDPDDKRRKVFRLTPAGDGQVALLARHSAEFEAAYERLNTELGGDLFDLLGRAVAALEEKNLLQRIREGR